MEQNENETTLEEYNEMDIGEMQSAPQGCNEMESWDEALEGDGDERFISDKAAMRDELASKKRKKLQVIRQQASGINISGNSKAVFSINVNSVVKNDFIVKNGKNFVTLSHLRASLNDKKKTPPTKSSGSRLDHPVTKEKTTASIQ
ncbi:uncharacterized protein [Henckelia pumila]|uniref:uncharacterized protein n=1 Tax=Henckelia pumila TaxID=405737 RepID=UPI003C6DD9FF